MARLCTCAVATQVRRFQNRTISGDLRHVLFLPAILRQSRRYLQSSSLQVSQVLSCHVLNRIGLLEPDNIEGAEYMPFLPNRDGDCCQAIGVGRAAIEAANKRCIACRKTSLARLGKNPVESLGFEGQSILRIAGSSQQVEETLSFRLGAIRQLGAAVSAEHPIYLMPHLVVI